MKHSKRSFRSCPKRARRSCCHTGRECSLYSRDRQTISRRIRRHEPPDGLRKDDMEDRSVLQIPIEDLYIHPKNVRKHYTDIEDLTASIKESGIWQNLTVVPIPGKEDKYYVVIGNRRLQAARAAGLKTCPCIIAWNMSEQEQQSTMLLENMQRRDLTAVEEANGMQMCLDLGMTEAELVNKTGLSRTTVKHRLEIAKLDDKALRKYSEESGSYQLSITDFVNLEKVKDVKRRNELIEQSTGSANLKYLIDREVERQKRHEVKDKMIMIFASMGITRILKKDETAKWSHIRWFSLADKPDAARINEEFEKSAAGSYDEFALDIDDFGITVKGHNEQSEKAGNIQQQNITAEKQVEKDHRELLKMYRELARDIKQFVIAILNDVYKTTESRMSVIEDMLWKAMMQYGIVSCSKRDLTAFWMESERYNVNDTDMMMLEEFPRWKQMLAAVTNMLMRSDTLLYGSGNDYNKEHGEALMTLVIVLRGFGYSFPGAEYREIALGRHEAYTKKSK